MWGEARGCLLASSPLLHIINDYFFLKNPFPVPPLPAPFDLPITPSPPTGEGALEDGGQGRGSSARGPGRAWGSGEGRQAQGYPAQAHNAAQAAGLLVTWGRSRDKGGRVRGVGARVRVHRDPKQGHRGRERRDGEGRNTHKRDGWAEEMEREVKKSQSVSIHKKGADTGKGRERIRRWVVPTKPPHPACPPFSSPSPRSPGLRPKGSSRRGGMVGGKGGGGGSSWWRGLRRGSWGLVQGGGGDTLGLCSPGWL